MRQFCFFICVCVLSSMFHATAMPLERPDTQAQTSVTSHTRHACDEAPTTNTDKQCHTSGHVCCLGVTSISEYRLNSAYSPTGLLNPTSRTLALSLYPHQQFKPPKRHLPT